MLTVLLLVPRAEVPVAVLRVDLLEHAVSFAALTMLGRWRWGRATLLLAGLVSYAAGTELVQGLFLSGRSGDVLDLLVDVLAALLVWLLYARDREAVPSLGVAGASSAAAAPAWAVLPAVAGAPSSAAGLVGGVLPATTTTTVTMTPAATATAATATRDEPGPGAAADPTTG